MRARLLVLPLAALACRGEPLREARSEGRVGEELTAEAAAGDGVSHDELARLAEALIVPVAGVAPDDLHDTFAEMRGSRRHDALDIPAPRGTPVVSAAAGRVLRLFSSENGGLMVYAADPTERFILMYAHLDRYADGLGDEMLLRQGQRLGYVGTTGNAPPGVPHLHFAILRTDDVSRWWEGEPLDPRPLLRGSPR